MSLEEHSGAEIDAEIARLGTKIATERAALAAKEAQAQGMRAKLEQVKADVASGVAVIPPGKERAYELALRAEEELVVAVENSLQGIRDAISGLEQARDTLIVAKAVDAEAKK